MKSPQVSLKNIAKPPQPGPGKIALAFVANATIMAATKNQQG
jgi:hypothetical protein